VFAGFTTDRVATSGVVINVIGHRSARADAVVGFSRFAVAGHDRGARVAVRLALDAPEAVSHMAVLDIIPTATIYQSIDQQCATTVWRYFFLIQPFDLPERSHPAPASTGVAHSSTAEPRKRTSTGRSSGPVPCLQLRA
jgi:pimeloyl-ACP methyl ester carboxylesterase